MQREEELSAVLAKLLDPETECFDLSLDAAMNAPFSSLLYQQRLDDIPDYLFDDFFRHLLYALSSRLRCCRCLLQQQQQRQQQQLCCSCQQSHQPLKRISIQWSFLRILSDGEKTRLLQAISTNGEQQCDDLSSSPSSSLNRVSIEGGLAFGHRQAVSLHSLSPLLVAAMRLQPKKSTRKTNTRSYSTNGLTHFTVDDGGAVPFDPTTLDLVVSLINEQRQQQRQQQQSAPWSIPSSLSQQQHHHYPLSTSLQVLSLTSLKLVGGPADADLQYQNFYHAQHQSQRINDASTSSPSNSPLYILDPLICALANLRHDHLRVLELGLSCMDPRPVHMPAIHPDCLIRLLSSSPSSSSAAAAAASSLSSCSNQFGSPCCPNLRELSLTNLGLREEHCNAIAFALQPDRLPPPLPHEKSLSPAGLSSISSSPTLVQLKKLDLSWNATIATGITAAECYHSLSIVLRDNARLTQVTVPTPPSLRKKAVPENLSLAAYYCNNDSVAASFRLFQMYLYMNQCGRALVHQELSDSTNNHGDDDDDEVDLESENSSEEYFSDKDEQEDYEDDSISHLQDQAKRQAISRQKENDVTLEGRWLQYISRILSGRSGRAGQRENAKESASVVHSHHHCWHDTERARKDHDKNGGFMHEWIVRDALYTEIRSNPGLLLRNVAIQKASK